LLEHSIILFDGVCNFCNYWISFTIDRDEKDLYRFAALQSEEGQMLLQQYNLGQTKLDTFLLIRGENVFTKSTAALMISKTLSGPVKIFYPFVFLPKLFRDFIYDLVAKNRYKIFGKREVCRVPTEEEKAKFL
jgi:predicted DCC family thiol-disulfide oxidoreductase YuxK